MHQLRGFISFEISCRWNSRQRNAKAARDKNGRKTAAANAHHLPSRAIFSLDGFRLRRSAPLRRSALFDATKICDAIAFPPLRSASPSEVSKHSATQIKI